MPESEWSTLPEEVYEGVGAQWDVYRQMRDRVGRNWEGSHPVTNVMVSQVTSHPRSDADRGAVAALPPSKTASLDEVIAQTPSEAKGDPLDSITTITTRCDRGASSAEQGHKGRFDKGKGGGGVLRVGRG